MGSPEFVSLVEAQFDVLATVLGVHRAVLCVRRENPETGAGGCMCVHMSARGERSCRPEGG